MWHEVTCRPAGPPPMTRRAPAGSPPRRATADSQRTLPGWAATSTASMAATGISCRAAGGDLFLEPLPRRRRDQRDRSAPSIETVQVVGSEAGLRRRRCRDEGEGHRTAEQHLQALGIGEDVEVPPSRRRVRRGRVHAGASDHDHALDARGDPRMLQQDRRDGRRRPRGDDGQGFITQCLLEQLARLGRGGALVGSRRPAPCPQQVGVQALEQFLRRRQSTLERHVAERDRHAPHPQPFRTVRLQERECMTRVSGRIPDGGTDVEPDGRAAVGRRTIGPAAAAATEQAGRRSGRVPEADGSQRTFDRGRSTQQPRGVIQFGFDPFGGEITRHGFGAETSADDFESRAGADLSNIERRAASVAVQHRRR